MDEMAFSGDELAKRLRATGLSRREIADYCGVTKQAVCNWLNGAVTKPHTHARARIARLLAQKGVTTS